MTFEPVKFSFQLVGDEELHVKNFPRNRAICEMFNKFHKQSRKGRRDLITERMYTLKEVAAQFGLTSPSVRNIVMQGLYHWDEREYANNLRAEREAKRHRDNEIPCPTCGTTLYKSHYADGERFPRRWTLTCDCAAIIAAVDKQKPEVNADIARYILDKLARDKKSHDEKVVREAKARVEFDKGVALMKAQDAQDAQAVKDDPLFHRPIYLR